MLRKTKKRPGVFRGVSSFFAFLLEHDGQDYARHADHEAKDEHKTSENGHGVVACKIVNDGVAEGAETAD